VMLGNYLCAESEATEIVFVYLDELGEGCVCEACGGR
jgi:hypothetical protein